MNEIINCGLFLSCVTIAYLLGRDCESRKDKEKGVILMENEEFNYTENFNYAKKSTVYKHAIVWIKDALENKKTDSERFEEIKRIIDESVKHL